MSSEIRTNLIKSRTGLSTVTLSDTGPVVTGIATFGVTTKIDGGNNVINVGTALTIGHTQGVQFHTQNLHSTGFEVNQVNASGIITASSYRGDGSQLTGISAGFSPDAQGNLVAGTNAGANFSGTDPVHNILIGYEAGNALTTADYSVAIGYHALKSADTESYNVAIGYNALKELTGMGGNVAVGYQAGYYTYNMYECVAVGYNAMSKPVQSGVNTWYSVAVGANAMGSCGGDRCTAVGHEALEGNNAGIADDNTAIGHQSLTNLLSNGLKNTAVGTFSGKGTTSGDENVYIGYNAGNDAHATGSNCIIIGNNSAASSTSVSNEITLGNANVTKFRIPGLNYVNDAGKVGIGTTNPDQELTLWSNSPAIKLVDTDPYEAGAYGTIAQSGSVLQILADSGNTSGHGSVFFYSYNDNDTFNTYRISDNLHQWYTSGTEKMRLDTNGRLGIGTDTPYNPLAVVGSSADIMVYDTDAYSQNVSGGAVAFAGRDSAGNRKTLADVRGVANGANIGEFAVRTRRTGGTLTEAIRVDSSGRLLIGHVTGNGYPQLSVSGNTAGASGAGMLFLRRGLDRATIGSNVGADLGEIDFGDLDGNIYASIQGKTDAATGSSDYPGRIILATTADGGSSPTERLRIDSTGNTHFGSGGTLNGTNTVSIVPADGLINFGMDGRTSFVTGQNSCYIYSGEGSSGTTLAGDLILQSRSNQNRTIRFVVGDGNASPTPVEKAKINQYGIYVAGTVSGKAISASSSKAGNFDPYVFDVNGASQSTETVSIKSQKNDCLDLTRYYTAGTIQTFRFNNDFTGHIETGTTSVTYHTSSDYRLKENAVAISDGITRLKQLKPYKFNFIKEPSVIHDGFFAHEVTPVVPTAVSGVKDATETRYYETGDILPEGKEIGDIKEENAVKPQSLDHSKLVPLLTAALQEAIARIETLEQENIALRIRVTNLEGE